MNKRQSHGRELKGVIVSLCERRNRTSLLLKTFLAGCSSIHDGTYLHVGVVEPLLRVVSHGQFGRRDGVREKLEAVAQALPHVRVGCPVFDQVFDETPCVGYVVSDELDGDRAQPLQGGAVAGGGCLQGARAEGVVDVWIIAR